MGNNNVYDINWVITLIESSKSAYNSGFENITYHQQGYKLRHVEFYSSLAGTNKPINNHPPIIKPIC